MFQTWSITFLGLEKWKLSNHNAENCLRMIVVDFSK